MDEKEKRTMKDDEYRALVEAGPAVVMVAKADMLKMLELLHRLEKAEKMLAYLGVPPK
jgi:hypothetical protein